MAKKKEENIDGKFGHFPPAIAAATVPVATTPPKYTILDRVNNYLGIPGTMTAT